jgi:hypothetical protein
MSTNHDGGCLCGQIRYRTLATPSRVTVCHCRFCQRATGGDAMIEPIFRKEDLELVQGTPAVYDHRSAGSGKMVHVNFCPGCGTKLWLAFERFADVVGVYAGTFDEPDWFEIGAANAKHIFLDAARADSIIPAGLPSFREHATTNDGMPCEATVYDSPHVIGGERR